MVVDDQTAVCDVISDAIRYAGHEIMGTTRDGVEAMRAVLEAGTARRVMSGEFRSTGLTMDDLYRSGAAAFLEKPFDVNKLFGLLDQWSEEVDDKRKLASKTS